MSASIAELRMHASALLAIRLAAAGAQAGFLALLARSVGPGDFVVFASVAAVGLVVAVVCDLGVTQAVVRVRAADSNDPRLLELARVLVWTAASTVVVAIGALAVLNVSDSWATLALGAGWAAAERYCDGVGGWLVADRKSRTLAISTLGRRVVPLLLLGMASVAGFTLSLDMALGAMLVASLATALSLAFWLHRAVVAIAPGSVTVRSALRGAMPFWINSIGVQLRQLDVVIVSGFTGVHQAAYYASVSRMVTPLRLIPTSFATAVLPFVARGEGKQARNALKGLREVLVITVGVYVMIGVLAHPILVLLFGEPYAGAVSTLRIMLIGLVFAAVNSSLNAILLAADDEVYAARNSLVTGIFGLLLVGVGAHYGGAVGAAWAMAASFGIQTVPLITRVYARHLEPANL